MFYLGIDVALNIHRLVMLDDNGERVSSGISFQNNTADFEKVLIKLKELSMNPDNSICGLEATGNNWENLYCFLTGNKFKTILNSAKPCAKRPKPMILTPLLLPGS
jgi:transposase